MIVVFSPVCVIFMSFVLAHVFLFLFFFNDTATTEIYTLSLHDALPICHSELGVGLAAQDGAHRPGDLLGLEAGGGYLVEERSEEHTSELQSPDHLVCRLLLEKKKKTSESVSLQSSHGGPVAR